MRKPFRMKEIRVSKENKLRSILETTTLALFFPSFFVLHWININEGWKIFDLALPQRYEGWKVDKMTEECAATQIYETIHTDSVASVIVLPFITLELSANLFNAKSHAVLFLASGRLLIFGEKKFSPVK